MCEDVSGGRPGRWGPLSGWWGPARWIVVMFPARWIRVHSAWQAASPRRENLLARRWVWCERRCLRSAIPLPVGVAVVGVGESGLHAMAGSGGVCGGVGQRRGRVPDLVGLVAGRDQQQGAVKGSPR